MKSTDNSMDMVTLNGVTMRVCEKKRIDAHIQSDLSIMNKMSNSERYQLTLWYLSNLRMTGYVKPPLKVRP